MKTKTLSLINLLIGVGFSFVAAVTFAQTRPEYILLGGGVKGSPLPTRLPFRTYSYAKSRQGFYCRRRCNYWRHALHECANPPTSYDNATKNFFDYAAKWINDRFSSP